jgi:hypothetical protein
MRPIDYTQLVQNYTDMINTLEYDSMRSAGKARLNADLTLVNMHALRDKYIKQMNSQRDTPKKEAN